MNNILEQLRSEAKNLAAHKSPRFYELCNAQYSYSKETFFTHPLIIRCREDVLPFLNDEFGHGIDHSKKVAIEAGTISMNELGQRDLQLNRHMVILAQIAGLLHDICRLEPEHAQKGAELAKFILRDYPLDQEDKERIAFAIADHEAFKPRQNTGDELTVLLSGALYDADKFRWGPDNFVTTLWEICDYQEWPLEKILSRFPQGMEIIDSISMTFRTNTGQTFGPEFIEIGLEIGHVLYRKIKKICEQKDCKQINLNSPEIS
jgi:hypothetical protein